MDVEPHTMNIDIEDLKKPINKKTKQLCAYTFWQEHLICMNIFKKNEDNKKE